jgi:hypothetical protein
MCLRYIYYKGKVHPDVVLTASLSKKEEIEGVKNNLKGSEKKIKKKKRKRSIWFPRIFESDNSDDSYRKSSVRRSLVAAMIAVSDGISKPTKESVNDSSKNDGANCDGLNQLEYVIANGLQQESNEFYEEYGDSFAPLNIDAWRINNSDFDFGSQDDPCDLDENLVQDALNASYDSVDV